jgi:hypothetical protein
MKEETAIGKYLRREISGGHSFGTPVQIFDTQIRMFLKDMVTGKSICSHDAITFREVTKGKNPEHFCRVCSKNINKVGILRCNDYLVIRNKKCPSAICGDCIKNKPDIFYINYRKALDYMKLMKIPLFNF